MFFTYVYHDPERQVPMYVGKGKDKRATFHLNKATNLRLKNRLLTLKALGLKPTIEIFQMDDEVAALNEEVRLIAKYGRKDLGLGTLYNATDGGEGKTGYVTSEETKKKIGDKNRNPSEATRLKQSSWKRGDDLRFKISTARKRIEATMSDEARASRSFKLSKQGLSLETLTLMSASAQARPPVQCPHCTKIGKVPGMYRHHFDRCKQLNTVQ